jgi:hypothetical protein
MSNTSESPLGIGHANAIGLFPSAARVKPRIAMTGGACCPTRQNAPASAAASAWIPSDPRCPISRTTTSTLA